MVVKSRNNALQRMEQSVPLMEKKMASLRAIDHAQEIALQTQSTLDAKYNQFNLIEVLQERAQGYTMLWQPQKALDIYKETDQLKPFRPLRDLGSYTIIKAQAHAFSGDIDEGFKLAIKGWTLREVTARNGI